MQFSKLNCYALALLAALPLAAHAANTPCSQGKGGVAYCLNGKHICNDGTISASKRTCVGPEKPAEPKPVRSEK